MNARGSWWRVRTQTSLMPVLALVFVLGACSGGTSVGDDVGVGQGEGGERIAIDGETTTTGAEAEGRTVRPEGGESGPPDGGTPPPPPPPSPTEQSPTTTMAPATTTTSVAVFEITINSDAGGGPQFDPSHARVFTGVIVRWVNADSQVRSVVADDGSFASGDISPGDSFEYRTSATGRFDYSDGTRPYAVGALEVVAR